MALILRMKWWVWQCMDIVNKVGNHVMWTYTNSITACSMNNGCGQGYKMGVALRIKGGAPGRISVVPSSTSLIFLVAASAFTSTRTCKHTSQ